MRSSTRNAQSAKWNHLTLDFSDIHRWSRTLRWPRKMEDGTFAPLAPEEVMAETLLMLEHTDVSKTCALRSDRASNYVSLRGNLPEDKESYDEDFELNGRAGEPSRLFRIKGSEPCRDSERKQAMSKEKKSLAQNMGITTELVIRPREECDIQLREAPYRESI